MKKEYDLLIQEIKESIQTFELKVHEAKESLHEANLALKESKNKLSKTREAHKALMKEYEFLNDLQDEEAFSLEIKDYTALEKRVKRDWDIERLQTIPAQNDIDLDILQSIQDMQNQIDFRVKFQQGDLEKMMPNLQVIKEYKEKVPIEFSSFNTRKTPKRSTWPTMSLWIKCNNATTLDANALKFFWGDLKSFLKNSEKFTNF